MFGSDLKDDDVGEAPPVTGTREAFEELQASGARTQREREAPGKEAGDGERGPGSA